MTITQYPSEACSLGDVVPPVAARAHPATMAAWPSLTSPRVYVQRPTDRRWLPVHEAANAGPVAYRRPCGYHRRSVVQYRDLTVHVFVGIRLEKKKFGTMSGKRSRVFLV
ncbi:hypothetical protein EVAR_87294_1 [Eumeta japonica]|uniref:Uncharacterized protein n=1 Tax=Eumeta variegata TaxID=151549 RepID=A0A4C1VYL9_EUMVA|nr:hypothetical protein EVAR_87294_1 [Eumeta japonica]